MITAVDLFCGAGGLTFGFEKAGIDVRTAVDLDSACRHPIEHNTNALFVLEDIRNLSAGRLRRWLQGADVKVMAGCAPCQPFSTYNQGRVNRRTRKWLLLDAFSSLVDDIRPEILTMENVPRLITAPAYMRFREMLARRGYRVSTFTVCCSDYGVPQLRKRLVLLASRLGRIDLVPSTHRGGRLRSVRHAIGDLPALEAGEMSIRDPLHCAAGLTPINLRRIKASSPGGSWEDWPLDLVSPCHLRGCGPKYPSVYGRMTWDSPAPTITTQCYNYGSGRFGHPSQNRALSLREAALLQSFPRSYSFSCESPIHFKTIGRLIGNAVPPRLGQIVGRSILKHLEN